MTPLDSIGYNSHKEGGAYEVRIGTLSGGMSIDEDQKVVFAKVYPTSQLPDFEGIFIALG